MKVDPSKINLSEKDIEDYLFENPSDVHLAAWSITEWIGRQIRVPSGIIDLFGFIKIDTRLVPVVVEVKNTEFTQASILQVCRYGADIQSALERVCFEENSEWSDHIFKIVVAKGSPSPQVLIEAESVNVYLLSFCVDYSISTVGGWSLGVGYYKKYSDGIKQLAKEYFSEKDESDAVDQI